MNYPNPYPGNIRRIRIQEISVESVSEKYPLRIKRIRIVMRFVEDDMSNGHCWWTLVTRLSKYTQAQTLVTQLSVKMI